MEDILTLRDEKLHLVRSAEDLLNKAEKEGRVLSEDEKTQTGAYMAEAKKLDIRIAEIEDHERRSAQIREESEKLRASSSRRSPVGQPESKPTVKDEIRLPSNRYGSLQAFKGPDADFNAYASGMWLCANLFPASHPMRNRGERWCKEHQGLLYDALSTGVPSAGGNLVPDAMSATIIDLREKYGIFRQWADVVPMTSDTLVVPRRTGSVTPYWIAENAALTASDPAWDNVSLVAKKLTAFTKISTEIAEDAIINIADWLTNDIGQQFAYEEDRVGFNGTGLDTDGGVTGLLTKVQQSTSAGSFIVVPTATHNTFAEVDATDLMTLMAAVPQYALDGAAFFTSQSGASLVFGRLMAAAGGNTQQALASDNVTAERGRGIVGYYQGYPIVVSQVLPTESTTKTNLPMLAFGNLRKAAMIGERRSINFATDASVYFATDQLAIRATARLDINIHSTGSATVCGPIAVMKGGSS